MRTRGAEVGTRGLFKNFSPRNPEHTRITPSTPPAVDEQAAEFEGQVLQEVAAAFELAERPDDPDSVFAALMAGAAQRRECYVTGSGSLPSVISGANPGTVAKVVKKAFDFYFRDDLYGQQHVRDPIILSSGSYDESVFGLPDSLKECIRYALDMNWYGYSNSLGRMSAREALAQLETVRAQGAVKYDADNIAVTMGGTAAVGSVIDLLAEHAGSERAHAVACVPNYPPLVASMARRLPTTLVPTPLVGGGISIEPLLTSLSSGPAVVLLQTVVNPWGRRIAENEIARVVAALQPGCHLVLDECHDIIGPAVSMTSARNDERVISLRSLSKRWAAPGLKAGWMAAGKDFVELFYHHASTTYGGPGSLLYLMLEVFALFEAVHMTGVELDGRGRYLRREYGVAAPKLHAAVAEYLDSAERMASIVSARRAVTTERLRSAGIPVLTPDYSINVTARIGSLSSYALYRRLLEEAGVSVLPGLLTMGDCRGIVRLSPCLDESVLDAGLDRLVSWYHCQD